MHVCEQVSSVAGKYIDPVCMCVKQVSVELKILGRIKTFVAWVSKLQATQDLVIYLIQSLTSMSALPLVAVRGVLLAVRGALVAVRGAVWDCKP